jgi:hypothetical protein
VQRVDYVRRAAPVLDVERLRENLTVEVVEALEQRIQTRVRATVDRDLAPDSQFSARVMRELYQGLEQSLVLERERFGRS